MVVVAGRRLWRDVVRGGSSAADDCVYMTGKRLGTARPPLRLRESEVLSCR